MCAKATSTRSLSDLWSFQFFDFHTTKLEHVVQIPSAIASLTFQSDSGLIALICDDTTVRLVDMQTRRVVRELRGFRGRLLDMVLLPV